jgi:acyl carrier protein
MTQRQSTASEAPVGTADRVREITATVLGITEGRVVEDADFVADLEDAFGIEISDSAAERIATVGDLVAFIRSQAPAQAPARA